MSLSDVRSPGTDDQIAHLGRPISSKLQITGSLGQDPRIRDAAARVEITNQSNGSPILPHDSIRSETRLQGTQRTCRYPPSRPSSGHEASALLEVGTATALNQLRSSIDARLVRLGELRAENLSGCRPIRRPGDRYASWGSLHNQNASSGRSTLENSRFRDNLWLPCATRLRSDSPRPRPGGRDLTCCPSAPQASPIDVMFMDVSRSRSPTHLQGACGGSAFYRAYRPTARVCNRACRLAPTVDATALDSCANDRERGGLSAAAPPFFAGDFTSKTLSFITEQGQRTLRFHFIHSPRSQHTNSLYAFGSLDALLLVSGRYLTIRDAMRAAIAETGRRLSACKHAILKTIVTC